MYGKDQEPGFTGDHERAVEIGRLGGASGTTEKSWPQQQFCTKNCIHYVKCPAITSSMGLNLADYQWSKTEMRWLKCAQKREVKAVDRKRWPCFIKAQPPEVMNDFRNLIENSEEGLMSLLLDVFLRYSMRIRSGKTTTKELKEFLESGLKLKTGIYGDKQKVEHSGGVTIFQAPELRRILQERLIEEDNIKEK